MDRATKAYIHRANEIIITPATKQILCHAGLDPASRSIHSGFRLSPE
jgi:hypothetical protein